MYLCIDMNPIMNPLSWFMIINFSCVCTRVEIGLGQSTYPGQMIHFFSGSFGSLCQAQKMRNNVTKILMTVLLESID